MDKQLIKDRITNYQAQLYMVQGALEAMQELLAAVEAQEAQQAETAQAVEE